MGTSVYAHLVYGIDLGGDENGWNVTGPDGAEADSSSVSWWDDDEGPDIDKANYLLRTHAGGKPGSPSIEAYGHVDYPGWVLSVYCISVGVWKTEAVDLDRLRDITEAKDEQLRAACEVLGITVSAQPAWLLCSDWG